MAQRRRQTRNQHRDEHDLSSAREYLRVSEDRSDRGRSTEEQHGDNEQHASRRAWSLHPEPYCDQSVSASRFSSKARSDFARLIADLEADAFGAHVLMLWESSRLSRRVEEVARLLDVCEQRGVWIYVTSHGRLYNPAVGRDRRTLLEDAVDSDYESSKTSMRGARAAEASAANGEAWGKIPYGYTRLRDSRTGKPIAQILHPEQAPIVEEIITRLIAGASLVSVTKDLNNRGVPGPKGGEWSRQSVRRIAISPIYAGQRTWYGQKVSQGQWPAIVTAEQHDQVVTRLTDPSRGKGRGDGAVKHLLTGIAQCECGGTLRFARDSRTRAIRYGCSVKGCVSIDKAWLEDYVNDAVVGRLSQPDAVDVFAEDNKAADAAVDLQRMRDLLELRRSEFATGELDKADYLAVKAHLVPKIEAAEAKMKEQTTLPVLRGFVGPEAGQRWATAGVEQKREVIRAVARIVVHRVPRTMRGKVRPEDRVSVTWIGKDTD